ncbi:hypothetical protein DFJ73DRAFT_462570 [Zopfochytrium polystomum]|nr:hypothetical protein DFJ73DRAFT_462570 [Zopfochytrium polystomum]
MIVGTCGALVNDAHLPKRLYQLVIEDDTQMVELILLVTEVHLVPGLLEMLRFESSKLFLLLFMWEVFRSTPYLSQVLQTCNPHLLLLKFLIECMDEELLLDMLSSTETSLLELFLVYFKYLSLTEDNWRRAIRQYTYFEGTEDGLCGVDHCLTFCV